MKYLMRASMSPFENPTHLDAVKFDLVNTNSGNLLFQHAITRAVMLEDVEIDFTQFKEPLTPEEIEYINGNYDAFIIPLANAFRRSFEESLIFMTEAIRKLKIPCIAIGAGYQGGLSDDGNRKHSFDGSVREFCDAVLEKSSSIGIRGEITATYLRSLGYREDEDFTIIGCPSMYLFGEKLPAPKPLELTGDSRIHFNFKIDLPKKAHEYVFKVAEDIPDHYYIPQNNYEFKTMYTGRNVCSTYFDFFKKEIDPPGSYPCDMRHPLYQRNRIRGFVTAEDWIRFQKEADLSFGTRIHGNISGILAGTPVYVAAPDNRVLEIARYHNIPYTTIAELDESEDIFRLTDGVDFDRVLHGHRERFDHYLSFMNKNGLDTIFNHGLDSGSPFDRRIKEIEFNGPIVPFIHADREEQLKAIDYLDEMIEIEKERLVRARYWHTKTKERLADTKEKLKVARSEASLFRKGVRKVKRWIDTDKQ